MKKSFIINRLNFLYHFFICVLSNHDEMSQKLTKGLDTKFKNRTHRKCKEIKFQKTCTDQTILIRQFSIYQKNYED